MIIYEDFVCLWFDISSLVVPLTLYLLYVSSKCLANYVPRAQVALYQDALVRCNEWVDAEAVVAEQGRIDRESFFIVAVLFVIVLQCHGVG